MGREVERMKGGGRGEGWKGRGEQVFVQLQVKSQFISIFHKNFFDEHDLWIKKNYAIMYPSSYLPYTYVYMCTFLSFRYISGFEVLTCRGGG